jgi:glycerol-3-phosphate acyltransferase PlsY
MWVGGGGPVVGSLLILDPVLAVISMATGLGVALASRYASLGSITGSAMAIVLSIILSIAGREIMPHLGFVIVACGLIIAQHQDNISRLRAGTERKLGERVQIADETVEGSGGKPK